MQPSGSSAIGILHTAVAEALGPSTAAKSTRQETEIWRCESNRRLDSAERLFQFVETALRPFADKLRGDVQIRPETSEFLRENGERSFSIQSSIFSTHQAEGKS